MRCSVSALRGAALEGRAAREQHSWVVGPGPWGHLGTCDPASSSWPPASCEQGAAWGPAEGGRAGAPPCTGSWAVCTSLLSQWHHQHHHGPLSQEKASLAVAQRQAAELLQSEGVPVSRRQWVESRKGSWWSAYKVPLRTVHNPTRNLGFHSPLPQWDDKLVVNCI